ncbi:hypothetical protein ACLB2K_005614 [Fragaria x ananassa]
MEANPKTVLRCVAFLCMFVLSLAASPVPPPQDPFQDSKLKLHLNVKALKCAKRCALDCSMSLFSPVAYTGCFGLCMAACKLGKLPPGGAAQQTADVKPTAAGDQPSSGLFDCTQNCANAMSKVMTTNAKLTMGQDTASTPAKPPASDLKRYAEGFVDSCYLGCSNDNKLF